ncbi:MAG: DUF3011 domain-containing protein [Deltaproteobacteria bacterium]|nr:DUF3011 domain-containing protein [Deltaproteobacteria bacterium]
MSKPQWFVSLGRKACVFSLLTGLSVIGLLSVPAQAAQSINCASESGRHQYCRAQTDGYVRLDEQYSDAPCVAGRTWGYDDWGVWVDNGCRARFIVGRRDYYNEPRKRPRDYDRRDYYDESAPAAQTTRCASKGGRYSYCPTDTGGYVRLERQLSDRQCVKWQSWGYDSGGVWVDQGCRAEFTVGRRRGYSRDWPWQ